jgi:hypothetical protein
VRNSETKLNTALINRYTVKSQLPPAIAATVIAIQFAANNKTTMVFLYMSVIVSLFQARPSSTKLMSQDLQLQDPGGYVYG